MVLHDWHVSVGEFAEGPLLLTHVANDFALDDDLGVGRHIDGNGLAPRDAQGLSLPGAGDFEFVDFVRHLGRRRKHQARRRANDDSARQVLAPGFGFGVISAKMLGRHHAHAQLVVTDQLAAIPRGVIDARLRMRRDQHPGGNVRAGVMLGINNLRQIASDVDLAAKPDDFLDRSVRHAVNRKATIFLAHQRAQEVALLEAERRRHRARRNPKALVATGISEPLTFLNNSALFSPRCMRRMTAVNSCFGSTARVTLAKLPVVSSHPSNSLNVSIAAIDKDLLVKT